MKYIFLLIAFYVISVNAQDNQKVVSLDETEKIELGHGLNSVSCRVRVFDDEDGTIYHFDFNGLPDSKTACSVVDTAKGWSGAPNYRFTDVNFDGYKDLSFVVETYPKGDHQWRTYLFKPQINNFVYSPSFSELPDEIEIDSTHKTISYNNCSFYPTERISSSWEYRVIKGDLFLSKIESIVDIPKGKEDWTQSKKEVEQYSYSVANDVVVPLSKEVINELTKDGQIFITTTKYNYANGKYELNSTAKSIRKNE
ncbi:MAG: hypothetical protein ABR936_16745 [Bacteroidota bacterium]|jgi:hypothetical protein